jgi:hypothetical protein
VGALLEWAKRNGIPLTETLGRGFDRVALARGATPDQARRVQSRMLPLVIPETPDGIEQQFVEQLERVRSEDGPPDCRRAIGLRCDLCPLGACRRAIRT